MIGEAAEKVVPGYDEEIAVISRRLLQSLETNAPPKNRVVDTFAFAPYRREERRRLIPSLGIIGVPRCPSKTSSGVSRLHFGTARPMQNAKQRWLRATAHRTDDLFVIESRAAGLLWGLI